MHTFLKNILVRFFPDTGMILFPFFQLDAKVLPKVLYFGKMYEMIKGVEGDIVECGVGYSRTFQILCLLANEEGKKRDVRGFDSFEGFPEPTVEDTSSRNPKKGEWKVMTRDQVYKILHIIRIPHEYITKHIHIAKGFFEDTVPKSDITKIALLHLDVDLYASYKVCLEHLFPKVATGGIVLFDEYGSTESYPGAKKAIDEYFKSTLYTISKDEASGKYFVVKRGS